jgi:spore photoproduct lyase
VTALFKPQQVYVQEAALDYPLGQKLWQHFQKLGPDPQLYKQRIPSVVGATVRERFFKGKRTMVVSRWRGGQFQSCKPSAHWQLPLSSGCPGHCQYCYLHTNLAKRPFINVHVNIDEILTKARSLCQEEDTVFEGAATSDPVPVEPLVGSLAEAIRFFAALPTAHFRFVTKFTDIESLLPLEHKGKTEIRFSINCERIISSYELGTPPLQKRLDAAEKVARADYPVGFLVGPIFVFPGWKNEYEKLLKQLEASLPQGHYTFELITHRFTLRARRSIAEIYPKNELPLDTEERRFKYGQFGYGKYVYPPALMEELESFFQDLIAQYFPESQILYFV